MEILKEGSVYQHFMSLKIQAPLRLKENLFYCLKSYIYFFSFNLAFMSKKHINPLSRVISQKHIILNGTWRPPAFISAVSSSSCERFVQKLKRSRRYLSKSNYPNLLCYFPLSYLPKIPQIYFYRISIRSKNTFQNLGDTAYIKRSILKNQFEF